MTGQEDTLREMFEELLNPLINRLEDLNQEVRSLHRAIAQSYEPLISPKEACRILGCGRDKLNSLVNDDRNGLTEGVHWRFSGGGAIAARRVFYRDLIVDYAIRWESDPVGHESFCRAFHNLPKGNRKSA